MLQYGLMAVAFRLQDSIYTITNVKFEDYTPPGIVAETSFS
jgi:hypothetical protein